jgi:spermidine synthase
VKIWRLIDEAATPDGKTLSLHEHDGAYFIRVDGQPLMSTRQHTSEERLAELGCEHVKGVPGARVLIGGLGFGYTLRAALALLAPDASVVVAEILEPVIRWNRNPAFGLAADAMADRRVSVVESDVAGLIVDARGEFDSILVDVDNGPAAMTTPTNSRLYEAAGLRQARAAVRPGGCLAVWSAAPNAPFAKVMKQVGFDVRIEHARARGRSGARHTIFVGRSKTPQSP